MLDAAVLVAALASGAGYLAAVRGSRRAGWPRRRTACWSAGLLAAAVATAGPLAEAAHHDFPAHVVAHLLLAMAAPLLLVRGAPVTLVLRTLPAPAARRLSHLLRSPPVRLLTEPVVAATLDLGGLWVYYRTSLFTASHQHEWLHLLSHAHMFLAGILLAVALVGVDPMPHRRGFAHRATVLVLAAAAHGILAKVLYLDPPAGVGTGAGQVGAMIMYYGGDVIEIATLIVLCAAWYRSRLRVRTRSSYRARSRSASRSLEPRPGRSGP